MQINEDYEKRIQSLERRVQVPENIINGTGRNKSGRTPILSADSKSEIIRKHNAGRSYSSLAAEYGVSKTTIYNICHFDKGKNRFTVPVQRSQNLNLIGKSMKMFLIPITAHPALSSTLKYRNPADP